jgi:hypothetical protein
METGTMETLLDYHRTLVSTATVQEAYEAVTSGFANWWTDPGGALSRIGDVATFRFPPNKSTWTFRPVTLEPYHLVEHECVGANHLHDGLPETVRTEWLGTQLRFEISPSGDGSCIQFTHNGLRPELDCFDVCSAGWDLFFVESLGTYLNEGMGTPHK